MSLILDALNRSRQDADPTPSLATHHPVEQMSPGVWQYLPWMALFVALVFIAWLVMERFSAAPEPDPEIGAPVAELSKNIGSAVASVTTELKARAAATEPEPLPEVPVAVPEPVTVPATPTAQTSPAVTVESAATRTPPTAENSAVAQLYQKPAAAEEPVLQEPAIVADKPVATRTEQPLDIEEVLQRAREEVENASLDDHPAPFLASLSQQAKDDIPTLYYQRHDYSSTASQSSVVLNGKPFKVGGSPVPGMKVDEILPDSVVLSYRGTQFRLRALNSWINL